VISAALLWRDALRGREWRLPARLLAAALIALIAWGAIRGAALVRDASIHEFDAYAAMVRYIEAHDANPMVFNTVWSDFQRMMYWSQRARFVAGLDGHYLLFGDAQRFTAWYRISNGLTASRDDNSRAIREMFGAGWVVVAHDNPAVAGSLSRDAGASLEMRTRDGWLFRIR
jgi:hypothetical protein